MEHDARHIIHDQYGDGHLASRFRSRLIIAGAENGGAGYGVCVIPAGQSARQVDHGDLVPGPWAATFGLAGVIADCGGTAADVAAETALGNVFYVAPGDTVRLTDDVTVVVALDRRRYPVLTVVPR